MTVRVIDGFDYYSSSVPISTRWTQTVSAPTYGNAGRFGGMCLSGNPSGTVIQRNLGSVNNSISVGLAYKQDSGTMVSSPDTMIRFRNNNAGVDTTQSFIQINNNGDLSFCSGNTLGSNIRATALSAIAWGVWNYVEVELVSHASAGSVNMYVNGVLVASASGVVTNAGLDVNAVVLVMPTVTGALPKIYIDDFYCISGASRLGERRVLTKYPSADTAQKDWTPNSGSTNYSRVNEEPMNGDTSYVSAATVGAEDLYDIGDLGFVPLSIDAVQLVMVARKDDATARSVAPVLISGSTTTVGSDLVMTTSYAVKTTIFETDPDTSAAWTASGVNALQAGMKVTA